MAIKNIVCGGLGPGGAAKWIVGHGLGAFAAVVAAIFRRRGQRPRY